MKTTKARKVVTVPIKKDKHKKLKLQAVKREISIAALIDKILGEYLK